MSTTARTPDPLTRHYRWFLERLGSTGTQADIVDRLLWTLKRCKHPRLSERGRTERYAEMEILLGALDRRVKKEAPRTRGAEADELLALLNDDVAKAPSLKVTIRPARSRSHLRIVQ